MIKNRVIKAAANEAVIKAGPVRAGLARTRVAIGCRMVIGNRATRHA